jgi:hypothetical protein
VAGGKLTRIDYSDPIFEIFHAPRSGDFSGARFFRYRRLETRDSSAAVLASFDDGSPALIAGRRGKGRVLVWASTLDNYWSDLAVQAVYLPFVHQLTRQAAAYAETAPWFTVGQSVDVAGGNNPERGELVAVAPSGSRWVLPAGTGPRVLNLTEQGFYEVRRPGNSVPYRVVASNLDLAEADLTPMDPADLAAAVEPRGAVDQASDAPPQLAPEERERPQSLWWYLLVAAFVILAAETLVGNQLSRGAAT